MWRGELEKSLNHLETPLDFASKNNFSNLDRMADLEGDVRKLCTKVLTSGPPAEIRILITTLRDSFSGFGGLGRREKRKKIFFALSTVRKAVSLVTKNKHNTAPAKTSVSGKKLLPGGNASSVSIMTLEGVGSKVAGFFAKRSIFTVSDLLFYSPRKYDDRREIVQISKIAPGDSCTVRGTIVSVADIRNKKRKFFQVVIYDGTGRLRLTWFNYNPSYLRGIFKKGASFIIHGKVSLAPGGRTVQIIHPLVQDIEIIESEEDIGNPLQFGRIVPVYPLTEGLTQKKLRETVRVALDGYARYFRGLIPKDIRENHDLMDLPEALEHVHFPPDDLPPVDFDDSASVAGSRAHRTVIFFEFFVLQLGLLLKETQRFATA